LVLIFLKGLFVMNDTTKMMLRYVFAVGVSYASGAGWLTPDQSDLVTKAAIELGGVIIAWAPALYAAFMVDNSKKA
jgi:hypothetical protein